uniref:MYM-type domain-containing protein n=1 Tax=viral metagenome TaxID=1070528 RepID=A0A6C0JHA2_9ZZZZ
MDNELVEVIKKKRGRKKKEVVVPVPNNITIIIEESIESEPQASVSEPVTKKRGRKPKGGKLVAKPNVKKDFVQPVSNIILHLKCSMSDLTEHNTSMSKIVTDPLSYNPIVPPNIMTYNSEESALFSEYKSNEVNGSDDRVDELKQFAYSEFEKSKIPATNVCQSCSLKMEINDKGYESDDDINMKDVNSKLKKLKLQLYKNSNPDKKSACFWCTYEYDNPSCYIPKYEIDEQIYGYGSFCRPECAVAYLMKENIDDSTKFERYHLLNQIYSKIYDFKKNIKPAPNPYFLLDKFYGNLSIQEFRKLLKTEHMLLVIDKPMTRILPELHEDSEDFIMNIYGGKTTSQSNQSGVYKVKKQSEKQKGPSKSSIMKENFGVC